MRLEDLHPDLQALLANEIGKQEKILWVGRPQAGRLMLAGIIPMLFAIPWTAFAVFWVCGAAGFKWPTWNGPLSLFPLFGIPFVPIGLGMFSSPYWISRSAARSGYVITNNRAICCNWRLMRAEIASYPAAELARLKKSIARNGSGDLIFEERSQGSGRYRKIGFIGLADVNEVERIIRQHILKEAV